VAEKFGEAAKTYANDPVAHHLRAMNMLYEGLKQNSTIVIVPSTAVESMQLGGLAGLTALTMGLGQEKALKEQQDANYIMNRNSASTVEENSLPLSPTQAEQFGVPALT
jgi:hypothetical protein